MKAESQNSTTLAVLAELVGGRVSGDPSTIISGLAPLDQAGAGQITFLSNRKLKAQLFASKAGAIMLPPELDGVVDRPLLLTENPYLAFAKVLTFFAVPPYEPQGVMPGAQVHPDAVLGEDVTISSGCVIGAGARIGNGTFLQPNVVVYPEAVIGQNCLVHANVTIREKCVLGDRVIIQSGTVIGGDGFGFAPDGRAYFKIPQVGIVVIEDDVEIGSCCCIDRGTLGVTRVARGTKIDNLVQLGHNVEVGEDCLLVSQVGVAGSTRIGNHCTFGGQTGIAGHVKIGDNVTIAGRGGVTNDVESNQALAGLPVMPHREWLKTTMAVTHLPEMRRELKQLKQQVDNLRKKISEDGK